MFENEETTEIRRVDITDEFFNKLFKVNQGMKFNPVKKYENIIGSQLENGLMSILSECDKYEKSNKEIPVVIDNHKIRDVISFIENIPSRSAEEDLENVYIEVNRYFEHKLNVIKMKKGNM